MTSQPRTHVRVSRRRLWVAVALPPLVWAIQGLSAVLVVAEGCERGMPTATRVIVLLITLLTLSISAGCALLAYASWRRVPHGLSPLHTEARDQDEMLALVGLLSSGAFTVGLVWSGMPALMINLCEVAR
jgi:hypothetical protein